MIGKTIIFPDDMNDLWKSKTEKYNYTLILYVDSTDCTPCSLNDVSLFKQYEDQLRNQFNTEILLVIQNIDYDYVNTVLSNINIYYPFILDISKEFKTINKIPDIHKYQTFLINKEKEIIWIGSPVINKNLWNLFTQAMQILNTPPKK
jgi:hypothetical protein